jgi:hypothetical protein
MDFSVLAQVWAKNSPFFPANCGSGITHVEIVMSKPIIDKTFGREAFSAWSL